MVMSFAYNISGFNSIGTPILLFFQRQIDAAKALKNSQKEK
jgi:hypothetical protein